MVSENTDTLEESFLIDPDDLQKKIHGADHLVMLPAVAVEAMDMANDPDCSVSEFVSVIEKDAGLVTDILSLSNSSIYGASFEIKSVQQAVVTIGSAQCQNLIISSSIKSLNRKLPPSVEWARDVLWQHSVHVATISRYLNRTLKLGFDGEEFSGAMIHDVGRLLLAATAPDIFDTVDRLTFCESDSTVEMERRMIGTDHCEIGGWFAESSKLPEPLVDVIRHHHEPWNAETHSRLVYLIAAADHIANHLLHNDSPDDYLMEGNSSLAELLHSAGQAVDPQQVVDDALALGSKATESKDEKSIG